MEWWLYGPIILAVVMFLLVGTIFEKRIEQAMCSFIERRRTQFLQQTPQQGSGTTTTPTETDDLITNKPSQLITKSSLNTTMIPSQTTTKLPPQVTSKQPAKPEKATSKTSSITPIPAESTSLPAVTPVAPVYNSAPVEAGYKSSSTRNLLTNKAASCALLSTQNLNALNRDDNV